MTYKSYEEKIQRIASVTRGIRKCAKFIAAIVIVAALATGGYLFAKGMMIGGVTCAPVVPYGDVMEPSSFVVMGDASYEYAVEGSEEWSPTPPSMPGRYRVRAVTQRSFGLVSYSKPTTFTVERRKVTVTVKEDSIAYGDMPTAVADLGEGDRFDYVELIFENDGEVFLNPTMVKVAKETIRILNKDGQDVTNAYEIATQDKLVNVVKRPITLETKSATKVYDGTPLFSNEYSVTAGSLMAGDVWGDMQFGTMVTFVSEGKVDNRPTGEIKVYNTEGIEVTDYYDITLKCGTLEILPLDIVITTNSAEWIYGPKIPVDLEYTVDSGLPTGHSLGNVVFLLKEMEETSPVGAGVHRNECRITLLNSAGEEVPSENYRVNAVDADSHWGAVTVSPRPIILVTDSATKEYDALPLKKAVASLKDGQDYLLLGTHTIQAIEENFATLTDVVHSEGNSVENKGEVQILDAAGNDVTANYALTYEFGTLTVTPRPLSIKTEGTTKTYDGLPLQNMGYQADGLIEGHNFEVLASTVVGPLVNAEAIVNEFTDYKVKDANRKDVTGNYEITFNTNNPGMLQITPCPLAVTTPSNETPFVYNAQPYSLTEFEVELPEGHTWSIADHATIVNVGEQENTVTISIFNAQGEDVTNQFSITYEYGTLTVAPRPITITPRGTTKVYDGIALEFKGFLVDDLASENHTVMLPSEGFLSITNVAESGVKNAFPETGYTILDGTSDVTANYAITVDNSDENCGILEITGRPITIKPQDETQVYNGLALTGSVPVDMLEALVEGHTITMQTNGTVTDAEMVDNEIIADSVRIQSADGTDVTANYEITLEKGTLTVTPKPLTVVMKSDNKTYDGTPLKCLECDSIEGLLEGHVFTIDAVAASSITLVGVTENTLNEWIVMAGEIDVTGNYTIEEATPGVLTIEQKRINVKTPTVEEGTWIYDGKPHSLTDGISIRGLNEIGHSFRVKEGTATTITNVSESGTENKMELLILNESGVDVSACFDVQYTNGKLHMVARPITVQMNSNLVDNQTLYYNAELQFYRKFTITSELGLAEGHQLEIKESTVQDVVLFDGDGNVISCDNELIDYQILAADGTTDVSANYVVTSVDGELTISPRPITVQMGSNLTDPEPTYIYYNATKQSYKKFTITSELGLAGGHQLLVLNSTEQDVVLLDKDSHVTSCPNKLIEYQILTADGTTDVSANYVVTPVDGELTISPRPITIQMGSNGADQKLIYNAMPQSFKDFKVGELSEQNLGLLSGHVFTVTESTAQTDVTRDQNGVVIGVPNELKAWKITVIIDGIEQDVTSNYAVTGVAGTLTISPATIHVEMGDGIKAEYDGQDWSHKDLTFTEGKMPLPGHQFVVLESTVMTDIAFDDNGNITTIPNKLLAHKIISTVTDPETGEPKEIDLTHNYDVNDTPGTLKIEKPKKIVVKAVSGEWLYDGSSHGGEYLVFGSLAPYKEWTDGDQRYRTFQYQSTDSRVLINVQYDVAGNVIAVDNVITRCTIWSAILKWVDKDGDGNGTWVTESEVDVSANYDIEIDPEPGKLKVLPRRVTLITNDATWEYDGIPHSGSATVSGNSIYGFCFDEYGILEEDGTLKNYRWFHEYRGTTVLKVTNGFKANSIDDGTVWECRYVQINDGPWELDYEYQIEPGNYILSYDTSVEDPVGTLCVTQRVLNVKLEGHNWDYDGLEHSLPENTGGVLVLPEGAIFNLVDTYYEFDQVQYHVKDVLKVTKTTVVQNPTYDEHGAYIPVKNQLEEYEIVRECYRVTDGEDELVDEIDVTGCYWVDDSNTGEIGVKQNTIKITTADREKTYDGNPLSCLNNGVDDLMEWTLKEGTLAEGHSIHVEFTGTITDVGEADNSCIVTILDADGNDVTSRYNVEITCGKLTVNKRTIKIRTDGASKVYDGLPLTAEGYEIIEGSLLEGHTLSVSDFTTITDVGEAENKYVAVVVGQEQNYEVVIEEKGKLIVSKRIIKIKTYNAEKFYDGLPLIAEGYEIIEGSLLEGHTLSVSNFTSITDVGEAENECVAVVVGQEQNYDVIPVPGKLIIRPMEKIHLVLTPYEVHVDYDGLSHGPQGDEFWISNGARLPAGYTITDVIFTDGFTDAGTHESTIINAVIRNAAGVDVTNEEFEVEYDVSTVQIDPREIIIETGSLTVRFDGAEHRNATYTITGGQLPEGFMPNIVIDTSIRDRGSVYNVIQTLEIVDATGKAVFTASSGSSDCSYEEFYSSNFIVRVNYGVLTVTWR